MNDQTQATDLAALLARLQQLEAENTALRSNASARLSFKVSEKGAISIYGFGQWPKTFYRTEIERILDAAPAIRDFIKAHASVLATKTPRTD